MLENNVSSVWYGQKNVCSTVISVKSLPTYKLFGTDDKEVLENIRHSFSVILNEIGTIGSDGSLSVEMIWSCTPAVNQPFDSNIDIKIIFRSVSSTEAESLSKLKTVCSGFIIGLNGMKMVTEFGKIENYTDVLKKISENDLISLKRGEEIMGFNIPNFQSCYKYDTISDETCDMDYLVNTLIKEKNSAVIIQIIPTTFTLEEKNYISTCTDALGRLCNGFSVPRMGFYRDQRAESPLKTYKKYYVNLSSPLFITNILISTPKNSTGDLSSKIKSLMNDGGENITNFEMQNLNSYKNLLFEIHTSPWRFHDVISNCERNGIFMSFNIKRFVFRLPFIYSSMEVARIFRLPIGTKKVTAGFAIHEIDKRHKEFDKGIINTADIPVGRLQNVIGGEEMYIGFNLNDLPKHMLVVGTPGTGKTTFSVGMLDMLWKKHGIPFLVIEPAKNEYRSLIDSIPDLQVFSPGKNNIAPFVMNPFVPPKGVTVEKHKSIIKGAFTAAFEMWEPLGQLFDETLSICYSEQGWTDSTTVDDSSNCFSLADFIREYKRVVASKGYTGEYKKQIEAAGVLRFNGLIQQNPNVVDSRYSVPLEDILKHPTVIELTNIKDVKQKSFIIALLLNNIRIYIDTHNINDGKLKNVILLEEAHALLQGEKNKSEEASSNQAAVKLLTDMLAEIRSRGVGIVVADQRPEVVTSSVISNTDIKIMFRLSEASDKEIMQGSTNMTETQRERLSNLGKGRALFFYSRLTETEEVLTDDYRRLHNISTDLSDEAVKSKMTYWKTHGKLLKPYSDCDSILQCEESCNIEIREYARVVADRIFRNSFPEMFKDFASFAEFYKRINYVIKEETQKAFNGRVDYKAISRCVKVHFLRKVHYDALINLNLEKRKEIYKNIKQ